jgi:tetratricopeptide (TPR) repeat protein
MRYSLREMPRILAVVAMSSIGLSSFGSAGAFAQSKASPGGAAQSTSAQTAAATFDQVAKRAADARAASRFDEAIDDYRQAIKLKPGWIEGRFALGTLLYDQDKYPEALDELRRVVQAQPKNGLVLALKGLCELKVKNYERALNDLLAARALGIPSPEVSTVASFNAAALLNRYERYEQAYEILKDFALKDKDSQAVIEVFGLSVLRLPYLPSEVPPDKREMVLMAGRAAFHQARGRNTPLARQFFEELVSRYPTAPNVHYAYGVCLWVEDPQAAVEEFRRELRSSPNHHHAMLQIAFEQLKQGQYAEALALSQRAVELAPNLFAARNALGRALLELGEVDRAVAELEMGAKLAPDSPETFFSLARAYAKQGRAEDAARARATFLKLGAARRTARSGPESVGGMPPEAEAPPPQKN